MFGTTIPNDPEKSKENRKKIVEKISGKQKTDLDYHNKEKNEIRNYEQGETVYVKIDKRLGSKLTPRYKKEIVAENRNSTIKTKSEKIVHKNNIRT